MHPLDPVFDGFLIHSRGASVAPLDGDFASRADREDAEEALADGVLIRTDLDVPVMIVETETDLTLLGYANARQPDTDLLRTWEVAGTAHADAHFMRSIVGGPRDPGLGSLIGCPEPINTGPHHEVVSAAFHDLVTWVADGTTPPAGEADRAGRGRGGGHRPRRGRQSPSVACATRWSTSPWRRSPVIRRAGRPSRT